MLSRNSEMIIRIMVSTMYVSNSPREWFELKYLWFILKDPSHNNFCNKQDSGVQWPSKRDGPLTSGLVRSLCVSLLLSAHLTLSSHGFLYFSNPMTLSSLFFRIFQSFM